MLLSSKIILIPEPVEIGDRTTGRKILQGSPVFVSDRDQSLTRAIGQLVQGKEHHFYSYGNFNLVRLICYLLKQTGPANLMMTSYSFSHKSTQQIKKSLEVGELLSFKVILDNRVRVMSPKPFQMIVASFDYRCISVHAKVALIWNDQWKITVITSQNATDNPKLERGIIFTDLAIFEFDYNNLINEFERGAT